MCYILLHTISAASDQLHSFYFFALQRDAFLPADSPDDSGNIKPEADASGKVVASPSVWKDCIMHHDYCISVQQSNLRYHVFKIGVSMWSNFSRVDV